MGIGIKRKLGPLTSLIFDSTYSYGISNYSDDIIVVDSSREKESFLFYSSKEKFKEFENEIRKDRNITNPSKLVYYEFEKSFNFNNALYNEDKEVNIEQIGVIRAAHIIEINHHVSDIKQAQDFIKDILDEASIRLTRAVSRASLIEVPDHVINVSKDGRINTFLRFLGIGGIDKKICYRTEIDKSRIALNTIIKNSISKVKSSYDKERRNNLSNLAGIVIFELLLTEDEKNLKVLYSL